MRSEKVSKMRSKILLTLVLFMLFDDVFPKYLLVEIDDKENDKKLRISRGAETTSLKHSFRSHSATSGTASGSHHLHERNKDNKVKVKNNNNKNSNPG